MLPFLKWAGGKRWLVTPEFLANLPPHNRYIEPFLGGGASFFALGPDDALICDVNPELITAYEVVRDSPKDLYNVLVEFQESHSSELYYKIRGEIPDDKVRKAARTLYLNRTCWNGLYRLNKKGEFNVPIGTKTQIVLPTDNFLMASEMISRAELLCCDFEVAVDMAGDGDFIFVDPPYTVKHNMNGFVKYNESIFSWDDQVRLKDALVRASERGARYVLTNADHESVRHLYCDIGVHKSVKRRSVISGRVHGRASVTELVISV